MRFATVLSEEKNTQHRRKERVGSKQTPVSHLRPDPCPPSAPQSTIVAMGVERSDGAMQEAW